MDQTLPRLNELFLGDALAQLAADPVGDPAVRMPSVLPSPTPRANRLIGLVSALILGLVSIAATRAEREQAIPPDAAAMAAWGHPGSHVHGARLRNGSIHRSHKHPLAIPRIVSSSSYDSQDDEATEDYDDDDAWDTNRSDDDSNAPIMAWLRHMVPSLIGHNSQSPPPCIESASPLFLRLKRLLC